MSTHKGSDNLELRLLRTFLAVVEHGSLGKTAVAINKTQPAISQQMLRLEKIVGQRLFARRRESMKMTRQGQLLATYAHRAVELNEEILLRLRSDSPGRHMAVRMTATVALVGLPGTMSA